MKQKPKNQFPTKIQNRELQSARDRNHHLEEKVRTLEQHLNGNWYDGQPAQKIYLRQAEGNLPRVHSKERARERRISRPIKKHYSGDYYKICWHCGNNGHIKKDCEKAKQFTEDHKKRRNSMNRNLDNETVPT